MQLGELIAPAVDELIIKEDDRRGRQPGECAELLRRGALAGGLRAEQITSWLPELEAVDLALHRAQPGDLLVVFASDIPSVWQRVISFKGNGDSADGNGTGEKKSSGKDGQTTPARDAGGILLSGIK